MLNILAIVDQLKQQKPLVLNLTNDVTMDMIANGLLCLGASPLMIKAKQEVHEIVNIAQSLVINIGTLNEEFIELSAHACKHANQLNKPIILDPVGAGASLYRTQTCLKLLDENQIAMIRGNASEIKALAELSKTTKGVDSTCESTQAIESARLLSNRYHATVIISGETDIIVDGDVMKKYQYGSELMSLVTGAGCLFSAVIAAFHAVEKNRLNAAIAATVYYSLCGEMAAKTAKKPGTFKAHFLDALYAPNALFIREKYHENQRVENHC